MKLSYPNRPLRLRRAFRRSHEQSLMQRPQIEAAIETVREGAEISRRILSESESMVTTAQTGLEVAEQGVDPLELGHISGLSSAHDNRPVRTSRRGERDERGQPVAVDDATRGDAGRGLLRDGRPTEVRHDGEFGAQRPAILADRDGRNERDLVLGAPTDLAPATLTPEVGVIDLDLAGDGITGLPRGHRLHQFVVNEAPPASE